MTALDRFRSSARITAGPAPGHPVAQAAWAGRDPGLAEVLARLEVAAALGDQDAAARLLDSLAAGAGGGCGVWLHRQMAAAALRAMARTLAT